VYGALPLKLLFGSMMPLKRVVPSLTTIEGSLPPSPSRMLP
jgi:hypothetical protein